MIETKYGKYIVYETQTSPLHPPGSFPGIPLVRMDDNFMKGAFYFECIWLTGTISEDQASKPHSHDCDEYIGFFGSDTADPFNLNGEIEFWFDDEKHMITRSCLVYVPAGIWHTPIIVHRLDKPIFCLSASPVSKYIQKVNQDARWSKFKDPPEVVRR